MPFLLEIILCPALFGTAQTAQHRRGQARSDNTSILVKIGDKINKGLSIGKRHAADRGSGQHEYDMVSSKNSTTLRISKEQGRRYMYDNGTGKPLKLTENGLSTGDIKMPWKIRSVGGNGPARIYRLRQGKRCLTYKNGMLFGGACSRSAAKQGFKITNAEDTGHSRRQSVRVVDNDIVYVNARPQEYLVEEEAEPSSIIFEEVESPGKDEEIEAYVIEQPVSRQAKPAPAKVVYAIDAEDTPTSAQHAYEIRGNESVSAEPAKSKRSSAEPIRVIIDLEHNTGRRGPERRRKEDDISESNFDDEDANDLARKIKKDSGKRRRRRSKNYGRVNDVGQGNASSGRRNTGNDSSDSDESEFEDTRGGEKLSRSNEKRSTMPRSRSEEESSSRGENLSRPSSKDKRQWRHHDQDPKASETISVKHHLTSNPEEIRAYKKLKEEVDRENMASRATQGRNPQASSVNTQGYQPNNSRGYQQQPASYGQQTNQPYSQQNNKRQNPRFESTSLGNSNGPYNLTTGSMNVPSAGANNMTNPSNSMYPPQGGMYPPQGGAYPPQGGVYPPQGGAYPPQSGIYPPQSGVYPPQGGAYGTSPGQSGMNSASSPANNSFMNVSTPINGMQGAGAAQNAVSPQMANTGVRNPLSNFGNNPTTNSPARRFKGSTSTSEENDSTKHRAEDPNSTDFVLHTVTKTSKKRGYNYEE